MSLDTAAAQLWISQGTHGQTGLFMRSYIGITSRIAGADIIGSGRVYGFGAIDHGRGTQERLGTAVGAFNVHSPHGRIIPFQI